MTYTGDEMDLAHQDYHASRAEEAERLRVREERLRERALVRFPESSLGPPAYPGGPPTLLSSDRFLTEGERATWREAQREQEREWLRDGDRP